jgi:hypothetical protein
MFQHFERNDIHLVAEHIYAQLLGISTIILIFCRQLKLSLSHHGSLECFKYFKEFFSYFFQNLDQEANNIIRADAYSRNICLDLLY